MTKHGNFPVCSTCDFPIDASGFCSGNCCGGDAVMKPCTCIECENDRKLERMQTPEAKAAMQKAFDSL